MAKQKRQPLAENEKLELVKSLQSEYEIIQTKIDNIGNFKFVVRGWLITIYSAFVFGLFSDAVSSNLCLWLGTVIIFVFHLLEREQIINQNKLSNRSKLIESSIYKLSLTSHWSQKKQEIVQLTVLNDLISVPRVSAVLTARRAFKIFRKDHPRPKGIFESIGWFVGQAWDAVTWFVSLKVYWLFWFLYLATVGMHLVLNSENLSTHLKVKNENKATPSEINIYKNDNRHFKHQHNMRQNSSIEALEEEMYSLVSQIDYGDISDIDTYWESLREALIDLEIEGWTSDSSLTSADLIGSLPVNSADELCDLAVKMTELCDSGSNSSISDEKLDELQDLAASFESGFEKLLEELDEIAKK